MNKSLLILISTLAWNCLSAQTIPVKEIAGGVSEYECSLRKYDPDPNASAVILWEKCEESADPDVLRGFLTYRTTVTQRLKILKASGMKYANLDMILNEYESLKDVSVKTYNLSKYGGIDVASTTKDDCIREKLPNDFQHVTYHAKKVKTGSVVEISYTLISPLVPGPHDFQMQRSIPVNLVTYSMEKSSWLPARMIVRNEDKVICNGNSFRAVDLPAFKAESMVYCPDQYITSVSYEFKTSESYVSTWAQVAEVFKNSPAMTQLSGRTPIRKQVRAIAQSDADDKTKLMQILSLVYKLARWKGEIGLMPLALENIGYEEFSNSADINSFAGAAFTEAGYTVTPVFLRTRSRGALIPQFPSPDAFDTYILHICRPGAEDGIDTYLDASNSKLFFDVLPDEFLVDSAMEVRKDGTFQWLDLTRLTRNTSVWRAYAALDSDGRMYASMEAQYFNVSSFSFKDHYGSSTDSVLVKQFSELVDCDNIQKIEVCDFNEFYPASYFKLDYDKACKVADDGTITVNPFAAHLISDKEFRSEQRTMPLEFSFAENVNYAFTILIPEGYEVSQLPESVTIQAEGVPVSAVIRSTDNAQSPDGSCVMVSIVYANHALSVQPEQYPAFREIWLRMARVLSDSRIVFTKK